MELFEAEQDALSKASPEPDNEYHGPASKKKSQRLVSTLFDGICEQLQQCCEQAIADIVQAVEQGLEEVLQPYEQKLHRQERRNTLAESNHDVAGSNEPDIPEELTPVTVYLLQRLRHLASSFSNVRMDPTGDVLSPVQQILRRLFMQLDAHLVFQFVESHTLTPHIAIQLKRDLSETWGKSVLLHYVSHDDATPASQLLADYLPKYVLFFMECFRLKRVCRLFQAIEDRLEEE